MIKGKVKSFLGKAIGLILGSILMLFMTLIFILGIRYVVAIADCMERIIL